MKLYQTPGGTWASSQKAWKAAMEAEGADPKSMPNNSVDIPTTPKEKLMEFLTFHNINILNPSANATAPEVAQAPEPQPVEAPSTTMSGDLDSLFAKAPIGHRLELAVLAIDAADAALRS